MNMNIKYFDRMKLNMKIAAMSALCCMTACGQKYEKPSEGSATGFALSFFRSVNEQAGKAENVVVSPYSAGAALSMLAEGAAGETRMELDKALNGCLFKDVDLGGNDTVVVRSANSVWLDDGFSLKDSYSGTLRKDYGASVFSRDFSSPSAADDINAWCSENTEGKIEQIVDKLRPDIAMVLVNALYFNAPWQDAFNEELTADRIFQGVSGNVPVRMMTRKAYYSYAEYEGCQLIKIPYSSGRYSMYVALPPAGMDMESVIPYLGESLYDAAMGKLARTEVVLSLPKFKLETSMVLNDALMEMGVSRAFSSRADFGGISADRSLALDMVKQKCYIEVSEKGTEAAAVTSIQIRTTAFNPHKKPVAVMTVDRPFLFFIADNDGAGILFAGKVVNL